MLSIKETGILLVVTIHAVIVDISAGKNERAMIITFTGVLCYILIRGTFWLTEKVFGSDEDKKTTSVPQEDVNKNEPPATN